jgi:hypothetical protein
MTTTYKTSVITIYELLAPAWAGASPDGGHLR